VSDRSHRAAFSTFGGNGRERRHRDHVQGCRDVVGRLAVTNGGEPRRVFLSVKYAIPAMRRASGGSIIITSSVAGLRGSAGLAGYCATKGGDACS
jgi:NAD(P)-dependent dehydrogenase (short-subunit alcohol dehydrogenase family)